MISPESQFAYVSTVTTAGDDRDGLWLDAHTDADTPGFAGGHPRIRFWRDQMTLVPAPNGGAAVRWLGFYVGDAIPRFAAPGDVIAARRGPVGGIDIVMTRAGRLVLALGALAEATSWGGLEARSGLRVESAAGTFTVSIGGATCRIGPRQSSSVGGYDAYCEAAGTSGLDSVPESLSVVIAGDDILINSARRSATLMAMHGFDPLRGERADGTYIKAT